MTSSSLLDSHPVRNLSERARALWAKSGSDKSRIEGEEPWLCLPQHMVDSAGTARHLWETWVPPAVRASISHETSLSEEHAGVLLTWLAAAHDLGKALLTFQRQLEPREGFSGFSDRLHDAGLPLRPSNSERNAGRLHHSVASRVLVEQWLIAQGVHRKGATGLAEVLEAHHGSPARAEERDTARDVLSTYTGVWGEVHQELLDFAADISGIRDVLPLLPRRMRGSGQVLLTGLVIMADWIASSEEAFPLTLSGYSDRPASERVREKRNSIDLTVPWDPRPPTSAEPEILSAHLRQRFSWPDNAAARPVQVAAVRAGESLAGPGLMIIEAPTGEGKTEAALTAAEVLAAHSGAGGAIIAAPTMSTADGLFRRVLDWSATASAGAVTSMFLAHSKSALNTDNRALRTTGIGADDPERGEGAVIASQWMSGRKKGILSTFSVATVDQVLFMALQAKHSMLRHVGLAGKVVIIDEVHAYDTYMSNYLSTALAWLARYRVPVVLLSATLPVEQKRSLLAAYGAQVTTDSVEELSTAYPLVTTIGPDGLQEEAVRARDLDLRAQLSLEEDDLGALCERLRAETVDGGCVLVICHTVRRAQETYGALRELFPEQVELHHAAFLASARVAKESALREALGPDAHRGTGRPQRRIVVATQVAEQSLDIDVDLLVTDLAPMDLLIQRIGRLHRHRRPPADRPENLREPRVLIRGLLSVDPPEFDTGAAAIYGEKLLLSTLAVLQDGPLENGFTRPDDIAPLVQAAYGPTPPLPEAWTERWEQAIAVDAAARDSAQGRSSSYRIPGPEAARNLDDLFARGRDSIDTKSGEARGFAQVRDSDPTVEVIPILLTENGYRPLSAGDTVELFSDRMPEWPHDLDLAASTVRLPARFTRFEKDFEATVAQLEAVTPPGWQTSSWLKGQLALPLDAEHTIELAGHLLRYDAELGLHQVEDSP